MRAVIQRVSRAKVNVLDPSSQQLITTGEIDLGLMVLLGIGPNDTIKEASWLAKKLVGLRIFEDQSGKMNLSVQDVDGAILAISQFTLYGDCRRGRRPSFTGAAHPHIAAPLFDKTVHLIKDLGTRCEVGKFGHHMEVSLLNNGPVTLLIDTEDY